MAEFCASLAGSYGEGRLFPSERGTPQGGVASPLLSNILLTPFDREMRSRGYQLTRYADDWVIEHRDEIAAVAVGTPVTGRPRADPYRRLSRIRLLPRVITANVCRMRSRTCDTLARLCVRHVLCWPAFPLVSALRSTGSAAVTSTADCSAGCSALFAGFTATMARSDFPRPCIIGYGSSPSRCGPGRHTACGQTQDIPGSNAIRLRVMWPSTPAGRQCLA
jgi:hypothetical protein